MAEPTDGQASYAAEASGVGTGIAAIVTLAEKFEQLALGEQRETAPGLEKLPERFAKASQALSTTHTQFRQAAASLLTGWRSKVESKVFEQAAEQSAKSLADSADELSGRVNGASLGRQIPVVIQNINTAAANATRVAAQARVQQTLMKESGAEQGLAIAEATGGFNPLDGLKQDLITVGQGLDQVGQQYVMIGQQARGMADRVRWQGPHSDAGPEGTPGTGPGTPGSVPAGSPGGAPGGTPGGAPGGDEAGGGAGGAAGGEAGAGGAGEGAEGTGGVGTPGGSGGMGLTGLPSATPTPLKPIAPLLPIDHAATPATSIGPLSPVGSHGLGSGAGGYIGGGAGRGIGSGIGSGGGIGGAGLGAAGRSKLGGIKPLGVGDQQIPSVVKGGGQAQTASSVGQAPALPGSTGAAPAGGAAGAGSGVPPMMPPMGGAAAGAGAGRGGKPGTGAIRPAGRERSRTGGPAPGVPDRLRGRAGKQPMFPAAPAAKSTAKRDHDRPETLQILDEELWSVEPETDVKPSTPRLAT
ncbi:hypothetical protein EV137_4246 [Kribbella pratensis]|uniref:PPE family protein n=1 Tax=Kribbella pratensis TaxID=2512112 RepID=A0ABY2FH41_9ACTN|nr:hypothetical protein [Kribbella pratensis]TDW90430.1 hypothetical protein EV137_4246 [Kribbella pratensis]